VVVAAVVVVSVVVAAIAADAIGLTQRQQAVEGALQLKRPSSYPFLASIFSLP
jgi:hypothetical protein